VTAQETALAAARAIHVGGALSAFGALVFRLAVADDGGRRLVRASVVVSLLAGAVWLALEAAVIADAGTPGAVAAALWPVASGTHFGRMMLLRLVALVVLIVVCGARRGTIPAAVLAGGVVASQALLGHAAATGGVTLEGTEALHLLAAGAWLGGLLPLALVVARRPAAAAGEAAAAFSPLGLACVLVIAGTGLVQGTALIGGFPALIGTAYGRVALLKLGLFVALLALAVANRFVLAGRRGLVVSIGVETVLGCAVIAAAGTLATLPPGVHEQPVCPLEWRPTLSALSDPDLRAELAPALAAVGAAIVCAALALMWRRARWAGAGVAVALCIYAAPHLDLLRVPAYPTSFYESPTGFAASGIVSGLALYARDCADCHGAGGRGDGKLAAGLPVPPADLTAGHLWEHPDGELYWWISHGMPTPDGAGLAMPAFPALGEDDVWALIDAIRARNAGTAFAATGAWPHAIAAPDIALRCAEGARSLSDLRGGNLRVVADASAPALPDRTVRTILLDPGEAGEEGTAPPPGADCVADDPAAPEAYAQIAGVTPSALAGWQFVIDRDGMLRAAWAKGDKRGPRSPAELVAAIGRLCAAPLADAPGGHHHHM
jgi:putative copper export protein/mono/diheme cytochrome c family protein